MRLSDIVEKLEDTQVEIAHINNVISERSDTPPSVLATLRGYQKRQQQLEVAFANKASEQFLDVCSCRLFAEAGDEPPQLPSVANALLRFQTVYSVTYSALDRPKKTTQVSADVVAATTFNYGYTFSGSVGFVLTLPNEQLLLDETNLDKAMDVVFEMAQADSSDQIAIFARKYGAGPVRAMYRWADALVQGGLGVDIDWRRKDEVRARLFREIPQLRDLALAIQETSDEIVKEHRMTAELVGLDVDVKNFHMKFGEKREIRGKISDSIPKVEIPNRYVALIRTTTKINYATEREDVSHFLVSLEKAS